QPGLAVGGGSRPWRRLSCPRTSSRPKTRTRADAWYMVAGSCDVQHRPVEYAGPRYDGCSRLPGPPTARAVVVAITISAMPRARRFESNTRPVREAAAARFRSGGAQVVLLGLSAVNNFRQ